ncbi:MAG: hypothetical protein JXR91_12590 [Deltaproteobacteria bacterium]|nr:hypothetical protein [Deltaproteobacteria bacterium]
MKVSLIALIIFSFLFSGLSYADSSKPTFSGSDVKALIPVLKHHDTVGLTVIDKEGVPESINLATRIRAKRDTVFNIFKDPDNFYYISTLFKENKILDSTDNMILWSWASRHSLFTITGKNSIELYGDRRADVKVIESSIGKASFILRFYEDGPDYTILTISGFLNVQSSQWLIKFIIGNSSSMIQAFNIAVGFFVIKGIKSLAEREEKKLPKRIHITNGRSGGTPQKLSGGELKLLSPFLNRGQVFLCDSHTGGRLKQATVIERVNSSAEKFIETVKKPENYEKNIGAINNIKIISSPENDNKNEILFSWNLGFAVFQLTSNNKLTVPVENLVLLESVDGDLEGSKWLWQIEKESEKSSIVVYHAFADVAKMSAILDSTVKREPYLEHGLVMGSNIVMVKAMKKIAESK